MTAARDQLHPTISKTRNRFVLNRARGFESHHLRQIEWTDEFYSSVHSFLPEHRPSTLSLGRMASC